MDIQEFSPEQIEQLKWMIGIASIPVVIILARFLFFMLFPRFMIRFFLGQKKPPPPREGQKRTRWMNEAEQSGKKKRKKRR